MIKPSEIKESLNLIATMSANKFLNYTAIIVNYIFIGCISSFIFEWTQFKYSLLDYHDYQGIYFFFARGRFIIPFSIFFIVWLLTHFFSLVLFSAINIKKTQKARTWIEDNSILESPNIETRRKGKSITGDYVDVWYIQLYTKVKYAFSTEERREIRKEVNRVQVQTAYHFSMLLRGYITLIIVTFSTCTVGPCLFVILTGCFMLYCFILNKLYQFCEVAPVFIRKLDEEIEAAKEYKNAQDKANPS